MFICGITYNEWTNWSNQKVHLSTTSTGAVVGSPARLQLCLKDTYCSAMTVFRHKGTLSNHIKAFLSNPWHGFPCQLKGKSTQCSLHPLGSFPCRVFIFSFLIKLLKWIYWGSPCQAPLLYPSPLLPHCGDNTRKQPAEACLSNKRTLSRVSFSHPKLQNMPSYPHCYQATYNTLTWSYVSQRMRVCTCLTGLTDRFTHISWSPH